MIEAYYRRPKPPDNTNEPETTKKPSELNVAEIPNTSIGTSLEDNLKQIQQELMNQQRKFK